MRLITISRLQCEFGLSYVTAARGIDEQGWLARKRYRMLGAVYGCGMLIFVGLTFTGIQWPHDAMLLMPLRCCRWSCRSITWWRAPRAR